jgi:hypothetical protein
MFFSIFENEQCGLFFTSDMALHPPRRSEIGLIKSAAHCKQTEAVSCFILNTNEAHYAEREHLHDKTAD